jgi:hypothetical protein
MSGQFRRRLARLEQKMAKSKIAKVKHPRWTPEEGRRAKKFLRVLYGVDPATAEFPLPPPTIMDDVREIQGYPRLHDKLGSDQKRIMYENYLASLRSPVKTGSDLSRWIKMSGDYSRVQPHVGE